jgi:3-oxoacyl-[acyl-carrier protein] reductase
MRLNPAAVLRRFTRAARMPAAEPAPPTSCLRLSLAGRVALVTGAGGELGRVIARTFAVCGADVIVHYLRSQERAEGLAEEIRCLGVRSCAAQADVASLDSVMALREAVARELGPVDIAVSNAVAWHATASVLELPLKEFEAVHRTCVLQAVTLAKVFAPGMIERRWGRIIGISSEVAMQALANTAPYTAGKRGMDGVLRVLARELGAHHITVNQVAPGWVVSDKDRAARTERCEAYENTVPLRHRGSDQDVANAVAFLASDLAGFITGVYLPVCGGNVMPGI